MDVGNDPFPRDEVTGLAAFENLEPVGSVSVLPDPPETPPPPPTAAAPRTFKRPIGVSPAGAAPQAGFAPLAEEKTEILNLDSTEQVADEDEGSWEDEATSILSSATLRPIAAPPAAALDMDWDDEEPPTRMRDDVDFPLPPIGGDRAVARPHADAWEDSTSAPAQGYDDLATASFATGANLPVSVPAPPLGRPSPFPTATSPGEHAYVAPLPAPMAQRGGAPSPFTATSAGAQAWDEVQKPARPAWMLIAAGAGAAVLLVLIGRWAFGPSAGALVTVATTPSDARVYVDGRPAPGTSSPFSVGELAAGSHELVVQKDGFTEHRSTFTVEGGATQNLPAVQLAAAKIKSGFAVSSVPSGAEIWVDGATTGKQTPAEVHGVSPGVHKLELKLAGRNDFELSVLVPQNEVLQLPVAELAPAAVASKSRSSERSSSSSSSDDDEPSTRHRSRSSSSDSNSEPSSRRSSSSEPSASSSASASSSPAPSSGSASGGGMLRLNSRPWSQVFVDGKLVGNTPQMGLPLSNGNHSIRLVNSQMGLTKTFSVSIKSGQMVTKVVNLVE